MDWRINAKTPDMNIPRIKTAIMVSTRVMP
jgi:hypothetical protein